MATHSWASREGLVRTHPFAPDGRGRPGKTPVRRALSPQYLIRMRPLVQVQQAHQHRPCRRTEPHRAPAHRGRRPVGIRVEEGLAVGHHSIHHGVQSQPSSTATSLTLRPCRPTCSHAQRPARSVGRPPEARQVDQLHPGAVFDRRPRRTVNAGRPWTTCLMCTRTEPTRPLRDADHVHVTQPDQALAHARRVQFHRGSPARRSQSNLVVGVLADGRATSLAYHALRTSPRGSPASSRPATPTNR
jgi:hypothetical protein